VSKIRRERIKKQKMESMLTDVDKDDIVMDVEKVSTTTVTAAMDELNEVEIRKQLYSTDVTVQRACLLHLVNTINRWTESNMPLLVDGQAFTSNTLACIIEMLDDRQDLYVRYRAAWALTNIALGTGTVRRLISLGAIPRLLKCLSAEDSALRAQAIWALRNITGDGTVARDAVIQNGGLPIIRELIVKHWSSDSHANALLDNAVSILNNAMRFKPMLGLADAMLILQTIKFLFQTQEHTQEITALLLWTLDSLTQAGTDQAKIVTHAIQSEIYTKIGQYLALDTPWPVLFPALRCISNVAAMPSSVYAHVVVIERGLLPSIVQHVTSTELTIRAKSYFILSNIAFGTPLQLQAIIDSTALTAVMVSLRAHTPCHTENIHMFVNMICASSDEQLRQIVKAQPEAIPQLCDLLLTLEWDSKVHGPLFGAIWRVSSSQYHPQCLKCLRPVHINKLLDIATSGPQAFREKARILHEFIGTIQVSQTVEHTILGEDAKATDTDLRCVVCLENKRQLMAVECHHFSMCFKCAGELIARTSSVIKCPLCNCTITKPMERIFS
jgi:hypothetical protein